MVLWGAHRGTQSDSKRCGEWGTEKCALDTRKHEFGLSNGLKSEGYVLVVQTNSQASTETETLGKQGTSIIMRQSTDSQNDLNQLILSGDANTIVVRLRQTATECQKVVAHLTGRDEFDPTKLTQFGGSLSQMLVAVVQVRDRLVSTDQRIHRTTEMNTHYRRFNELNDRIAEAEEQGKFNEEVRYRRELALVEKPYQSVLERVQADVRASLLLRLELLRHWTWFMRQALELYGALAESIVDHLIALNEHLDEDDDLRECIDSVIREQSASQTDTSDLPEIKETDDIQALRKEAMKEVELLNEAQAQVRELREESKELENVEVLLQSEIEIQGPEKPTSQPRPTTNSSPTAPPASQHGGMVFRQGGRDRG